MKTLVLKEFRVYTRVAAFFFLMIYQFYFTQSMLVACGGSWQWVNFYIL